MTNLAKPVSRLIAKKERGAVPRQRGRHEQHERAALPRSTHAVLGRVEDEEVASGSAATLLITASTPGEVENMARRIHYASVRAAAPFILLRTCALPIEPWSLREQCSAVLDAAQGGSLLMTDVEETPVLVQEVLAQLLAELQTARAPVRVIAGTTVSLVDRVALGTFSEALLYRLNVIHLVVGTAAPSSIRR